MIDFVSPSSLCQIEIQVSELGASLNYYREVFGWEKVPAYIHNLCVLDVKGSNIGVSLVPVGSLAAKSAQKLTLYFKIDSEEKIRNMTEVSARISKKNPPKEKHLPSYGKVFYVCDPDGHKLGLFCDEADVSS